MRRLKQIVIMIVLIDLILITSSALTYYKVHPDTKFFKESNYNIKRWLDEAHLNSSKINDIQLLLNNDIGFLQKSRREAQVLFELNEVLVNSRLNGMLEVKEGGLKFTKKANNRVRNKIDQNLSNILKKYETIRTPKEMIVLNGSEPSSPFSYFYFKKLKELSDLELSRKRILVNLFIDFKSLLRFTNEKEKNYLDQINTCYALFPVLCASRSSLEYKSSFFEEYSIDLFSCFFGAKTAISHGFIKSQNIYEIQKKGLSEFHQITGSKFPESYVKELNNQKESKYFGLVSILAIITYFSFVLGVFYLILAKSLNDFFSNYSFVNR